MINSIQPYLVLPVPSTQYGQLLFQDIILFCSWRKATMGRLLVVLVAFLLCQLALEATPPLKNSDPKLLFI